MQKRKMFTVLCAAVPLVLTACGGSSSEPASSSAPKESVAASAAPTASAKPATKEMDFNMNGRVIKWVSWYDEKIVEDNPDSIKRKQVLDELMKKHNFSIEYVVVDYGQYKDKVTASLIAGEPLGDIIRVARPWMIPSLTKLDLFWPLDQYTTNEKVFLKEYTKEYSVYEGKGYGMRSGNIGAGYGIIYNRTLASKLGMKPLQDYVKEDNWNWETFIKVAKEANKDTNNDGKIDTYGLASTDILNGTLASNNASLVYGNKQGLDDPKTLEALNFISRLANEKVARPTEGGDYTEYMQFFKQGNSLMAAGMEYEYDTAKKDMADYDLGFLPFPKGPNATQYQSFVSIPNYLTIPKMVKNPEQLVYIYEKMSDIESIYDYPQQAGFEKRWSNPDDINNAKLAITTLKALDGKDGYPNMQYYEMVGELREGVAVSTLVEKYKAQFQASIDEVWKK